MIARGVVLFVLAVLANSGCAVGFGATGAATRPLFGSKVVSEEYIDYYYDRSEDQSDVPDGMMRVEGKSQTYPRFGRPFKYVSVTGAFRYGSATPTFRGVEQSSATIYEGEAIVMGKLRLPIGSVGLGGANMVADEGAAFVSGWGLRASVAPIQQASIDAGYTWVDGKYDLQDIEGSRKSLGATLMLYGVSWFRLAVSAALTWTDAGDYQSSGYTYNLSATMY